MNCSPLSLYLMLILQPAVLAFPPAPENVSVVSNNFHHILRWDPGPGTPPGTRYIVSKRMKSKRKIKQHNATGTSLKLKLDYDKDYLLFVQASHNETLSPPSTPTIFFSPIEQTVIGPPKLTLLGCGNCIHVNISMPEADKRSNIHDIQHFYSATFRVSWKKTDGVEQVYRTQNKSFSLLYLESGHEYCMQVELETEINKNTVPSTWTCTFTSIVEPSRAAAVTGLAAALLIAAIATVTSSMLCLYHTGFLSKLKGPLPSALIMALIGGHAPTPEKTTLDLISINTETDELKKHCSPTWATNMEEEDEMEEKLYVDRGAAPSSGESSCQDSCDVSQSTKLAAPVDLGSLMVRTSAEAEEPHAGLQVGVTQGGPDQNKTEAQGTKGPVTSEVEEDMKETTCSISGNVNLLSVTLATLAVRGEEEQDTRDSLLETRLPSMCHTDFQTEPGDQTTVLLIRSPEDVNKRGYENRCADNLFVWDGETREEEEFSEYMGRP
ncbi:cytokine receptor family member b1 [Aulostomus maculatus]